MNYYIADTHFGHNNVIRMSKRPFSTIEEMDRTIIVNWIQYLRKLKGQKHLIIGNHDARMLKDPACKEYFVETVDMKMVDDNGTQIFCCHYPIVEWNGYYRNVLHFYGHIHNNFDNETNQYMSKVKNAYNVGVDIIGFMPRPLKEILEMDDFRNLW